MNIKNVLEIKCTYKFASGAPDFTSGFHRGSCCPVICVSLFHVIVLSFGLCVLIVPFVDCLVAIFFTFLPFQHIITILFRFYFLKCDCSSL